MGGSRWLTVLVAISLAVLPAPTPGLAVAAGSGPVAASRLAAGSGPAAASRLAAASRPAATSRLAAASRPAAASRLAGAEPTGCTVGPKLVPTCNILWGAAAGGLSSTPRDQALREWEVKSGRPAAVFHNFHRGDELFPTRSEIAMANDPENRRLLFTNWRVAYGTTWASVAAGEQDARIDRLAAHIRANYTDPFFMAIHHEPENEVVATAGSGMTAADFVAMYRHTVLRLRARGVTNVVFVVAYMALEMFYNQPWWYELYPGDDVVDWIGLDAYVVSKPGAWHYGTLTDMVTRTSNRTRFPGFYTWYQQYHADKPLMLAEWGVHEYHADPSQKVKILSTVLSELDNFPAFKGMFWFDTAKDQNGADIRIDSSPEALAEFRKIAADPRFVVRVGGTGTQADTTPPTVSVNAPANQRRVRGKIAVRSSASDASGISRVELVVGGRVVGTDTRAPFITVWDSRRTSGTVTLTVRAHDAAGNVGEAHRTVVADNRAPTIGVAAPKHNTRRIRGTATVTAGASDGSGVDRVELLVDGKVVGRDRHAPYAFRVHSWRYGGKLRVVLRAYDRLGNVGYAPARSWYR